MVVTMNSPAGARPRLALGCAVIAMLTGVQGAAASYGVATGATGPALRVDAKGDAVVGWAQGGAQQSFIVPPRGEGYHGKLAGAGADASRLANVALAMAVV